MVSDIDFFIDTNTGSFRLGMTLFPLRFSSDGIRIGLKGKHIGIIYFLTNKTLWIGLAISIIYVFLMAKLFLYLGVKDSNGLQILVLLPVFFVLEELLLKSKKSNIAFNSEYFGIRFDKIISLSQRKNLVGDVIIDISFLNSENKTETFSFYVVNILNTENEKTKILFQMINSKIESLKT